MEGGIGLGWFVSDTLVSLVKQVFCISPLCKEGESEAELYVIMILLTSFEGL